MTLLITGGTGTVGAALLPMLDSEGERARVLVRNPEEADELRGLNCMPVLGDLDQPETIDDALRGVDTVFLVVPAGPDQLARERALVEAADRAPDRPHVVKLAALGYQEPRTRLSETHAKVVEMLEQSGLPHTVLAPNGFMQDMLRYAPMLQEHSALLLPCRQGAVSHVDARDVAAVALHVLTKPTPHDGASYDITGAESLTYDEVAARMSDLLGREIRYVDTPPEDVRERTLGYGWSEWTVDGMLEVYQAYAEGLASFVTDEVQKATGRPARPLEVFLRDHVAAFQTI